MSKVPTTGSITLEGLSREFRSNRLGQQPTGYNVQDLQYAVASDGVTTGYGSQSLNTTFNFNGTRGKTRKWFTSGGTVAPKGGSGPTSSTPAGFTDVSTSYVDDGFTAITLPFAFRILGTSYTTAYVGSNGYITFGSGSSAYSGLSASNPPQPKIVFGAGDRNWTYVGKAIQYGYEGPAGINNISITIRIETNSSFGSNQTRGTANSVIEITFINTENCVDGVNFNGFAVNTGNWVDAGGLSSGVYSTNALLLPITLQANYSWSPYVYDTTGTWNNGNWQAGNYWYPWPNTNY